MADLTMTGENAAFWREWTVANQEDVLFKLACRERAQTHPEGGGETNLSIEATDSDTSEHLAVTPAHMQHDNVVELAGGMHTYPPARAEDDADMDPDVDMDAYAWEATETGSISGASSDHGFVDVGDAKDIPHPVTTSAKSASFANRVVSSASASFASAFNCMRNGFKKTQTFKQRAYKQVAEAQAIPEVEMNIH